MVNGKRVILFIVTIIEQKPSVHKIRGVKGDALVACCKPLTRKQMGCNPAEAGRKNKMERFLEIYIPLIEDG